MAAAQYTAITGKLIGGSSHFQVIPNSINAINNLIREGVLDDNPDDLMTARTLLGSLKATEGVIIKSEFDASGILSDLEDVGGVVEDVGDLPLAE